MNHTQPIVSYTPEFIQKLHFYNNHLHSSQFVQEMIYMMQTRPRNNTTENLAMLWKSLKLFNTLTGMEVLREHVLLKDVVSSKYHEAIQLYPQYHIIFMDFYHLFLQPISSRSS